MKFVVLALLCSFTLQTYAQVKPLYFFGDNLTTDSTKATAYGVFGKTSDSELWIMRKFDLDNNLLITGTYKDTTLNIPHGQFVYYSAIDFFNQLNNERFAIKDRSRFLSTKGAYEDGVKVGRWIDFFPDGQIRAILTYVKGVKHGGFMVYTRKGELLMSGLYANDQKEGEWIDRRGRKEIKEFYVNGELQAPTKK